MVAETPRGQDQSQLDVVGRWFRALDQRRIRVGHTEWLIQVTGVFANSEDNVWIQIADAHADGGSILLRVSSRTPVDDALNALASQRLSAPPHPIVVIGSEQPRPVANLH